MKPMPNKSKAVSCSSKKYFEFKNLPQVFCRKRGFTENLFYCMVNANHIDVKHLPVFKLDGRRKKMEFIHGFPMIADHFWHAPDGV